MFFLLSLITYAEEAMVSSAYVPRKNKGICQHSKEAQRARGLVSCPQCGARHLDLRVLDLKGKFRCKKCDTTFEREND